MAGDVAGVVGREEERGLRHLVGLAEAAHRNARHAPGPGVVGEAAGEPRVDLGGGDGVDRDPVLGQLHRHGLG